MQVAVCQVVGIVFYLISVPAGLKNKHSPLALKYILPIFSQSLQTFHHYISFGN